MIQSIILIRTRYVLHDVCTLALGVSRKVASLLSFMIQLRRRETSLETLRASDSLFQ